MSNNKIATGDRAGDSQGQRRYAGEAPLFAPGSTIYRLCAMAQFFIDSETSVEPHSLPRRRVRRGATLYSSGEHFECIYSIRAGSFKTLFPRVGRSPQVTGFHMAGDSIGLDGIAAGRHIGSAVALEVSEVCYLPFADIAEMTRRVPALQNMLETILSDEIVRDQHVMVILGSMHADERVAAFLVDLLERMRVRGWSGTEVMLRMTRRDIGSYLGLSLETVSRIFSDLVREKILQVTLRHVVVTDPARLALIASGAHTEQPVRARLAAQRGPPGASRRAGLSILRA